MRWIAAIFGIVTSAQAALGQADAPCGAETACEIEGGSYHLILPEGWAEAEALPALVFYHGFRSSGRSVFRSGGLRASFVEQGYAVIAPNGALRPGTEIRAWPARPTSAGRDDVAFTLAVIEDAARKVSLDLDRVYASGFSAGGSMAWMLGCYAGDQIAMDPPAEKPEA
ncbi:MAG: PHB depolymerase family esterase [Pseudomonadota bacterium]